MIPTGINVTGGGTRWLSNEKTTIRTQVETYILKQDTWIQTNIAHNRNLN